MKREVDYVCIGTGVAPLLAAMSLRQRGYRIAVLNPERDFFLEDSEVPLDFLNFENANSDFQRRFENNTIERVYRNLSPFFPGALELLKTPQFVLPPKKGAGFVDESAPWVRGRHRVWLAFEGTEGAERLEHLYLRALDSGWKPQWLEGLALAKRFPGVSLQGIDQRMSGKKWVGFQGPVFGDVDVERFRRGIYHFLREHLGELLIHGAHIHRMSQGEVTFQSQGHQPTTLSVQKKCLFFWTPHLVPWIESYFGPLPIGVAKKQLWEEWDVISREPVHADVVAHFERIRLWSYGEGLPPETGWNRLKIFRRDKSPDILGAQAFQEIKQVLIDFCGWSRFSVRSFKARGLYRWDDTQAHQTTRDGLDRVLIPASDGPLHWIAGNIERSLHVLE